ENMLRHFSPPGLRCSLQKQPSLLVLLSDRLLHHGPIQHQDELLHSHASAVKDGNWAASLPLPGNFPGYSGSVLKAVGGPQRVFRVLVDDVELRHVQLLSVSSRPGPSPIRLVIRSATRGQWSASRRARRPRGPPGGWPAGPRRAPPCPP